MNNEPVVGFTVIMRTDIWASFYRLQSGTQRNFTRTQKKEKRQFFSLLYASV